MTPRGLADSGGRGSLVGWSKTFRSRGGSSQRLAQISTIITTIHLGTLITPLPLALTAGFWDKEDGSSANQLREQRSLTRQQPVPCDHPIISFS